MFLKVMHDGADEFLATAQSEATYSIYADVTACHFRRFDPPGEQASPGEFAYGEARIQVREPIKTAMIEGFSEVDKHIILTGDAFLMNEQGRTISKFVARPFGTSEKIESGSGQTGQWWGTHDLSDGRCKCGADGSMINCGAVPKECPVAVAKFDKMLSLAKRARLNKEMLDEFYLQLPYWMAVWLKNRARDGRDEDILRDFARLKIAVDA